MSMRMASFLAGFGNSYQKASRQAIEDERQAKMDKILTDRADRETTEWEKKQTIEKGMADAYATRTVEQGTVTEASMADGGTMQRMFSKDPGQAAALKETMDAEAELRGSGPSVQQQGHAITGAMSKGHEIKTGQMPLPKMSDLNSQEAQDQRAVQVLRQHGKPLEAIQLRTSMTAEKAAQIGLKEKEYEWGITEFNKRISERLKSAPNEWAGVAQILSETQVGGLAGVKVEDVVSKDGKTREYIGTFPDGTKKVLRSVENTTAGLLQLKREIYQAKPETQISWLTEDLKREKDAKELALKEKELEAKIPMFAAQAAAYNGLASQRQSAASNGSVATVGLKERRDMLNDFGNYLPKVPEQDGGDVLEENNLMLGRADAIFSNNAQFGAVLTAPQVMNAIRLADDPKNVRIMRDNNTGTEYETVNVNGTPVIVGVGKTKSVQKPSDAKEKPKAKMQTMASTLEMLRGAVKNDRSLVPKEPINTSQMQPAPVPFGVKRW
jgi:hypothetical protein